MRAILAALMLCVAIATASAEVASWYGAESGPRTASGERFDPNAMTAAHRTLPFGTRVRVCRRAPRAEVGSRKSEIGRLAHSDFRFQISDFRCVVVRINDRGPFVRGRDIDLSHRAAELIGIGGVGVAPVTLEVLGR